LSASRDKELVFGLSFPQSQSRKPNQE